jgi:hypothetical protein
MNKKFESLLENVSALLLIRTLSIWSAVMIIHAMNIQNKSRN